MNREKLDKVTLATFRYGVSAGVCVLLWLQSNTVSKTELQSLKEYQALVDKHIDEKFSSIQEDLRRIYVRLNRLVDNRHVEPELDGNGSVSGVKGKL